MSNIQKIAGVVVLYHATNEVVDNIYSYIHGVDRLYLLNNSVGLPLKLKDLISQEPKYVLMQQSFNLGVAGALNLAAIRAIREGFEWLLTMDQDSKFLPNHFERLLDNINGFPRAVILSPFHYFSKKTAFPNKPWERVGEVWTSGNLLNLRHYQEIGPFEEKLFIDYVDIDYCLRAQKKGLEIIRVNTCVLSHALGDIQEKRFFWKCINITNHSPVRYYYRFRNRIFVLKNHPHTFFNEIKLVAIDLFKVFLFEEEKFKKLKYIILGVCDFFRNKWGKAA